MDMKRLPGILILAALLGWLCSCAIDERAREKSSIHYRLGYNYLQQGDSTSALRELLEAVKLNPEDPLVHHGLGFAYTAKGRYPEALGHYQKALELDPKFTEIHNARGATYLEMGKWDEAIQEFEIVLQDLLYQTPFLPLTNLGRAYHKKGDLFRAIESYKKAVALNPRFSPAFYYLGVAYKEAKQDDEAIAAFRSAVANPPPLVDAHFQLGLIFLSSEKRAEARDSFKEVVRLAPQSESGKLAQQYLNLLSKPAN
jgi:type IV pilus assembly protein PilF